MKGEIKMIFVSSTVALKDNNFKKNPVCEFILKNDM